MKNSRFLIAAAVAALAVAPAFAQESDRAAATLRVDVGSAMASTGGEFATVPSGTRLEAGNRVMLAEGNQATLVYENGCTQSLQEAGVYTVSATCVAAVAPGVAGAAGVDVGGAAIVSGIAVGGAAILHSMDDRAYQPPPPVSR